MYLQINEIPPALTKQSNPLKQYTLHFRNISAKKIMVEEEKCPNKSLSQCSDVWDVVVAIDIGTSFSGYAYSDKKEIKNKKIHLNTWNANTTVSQTSKAPTVVLLNENKDFNSFGYEAEDKYAEYIAKTTHNACYRFKNFKMILYQEKVLRI